MYQAIEFYTYFLLALLGFLSPMIIISLTFYRKGVNQIKQNYQTREKVLMEQIKELSGDQGQDDQGKDKVKALKKAIRELEREQTKINKNIKKLSPLYQLKNTVGYLLISFVLVLLYFIFYDSGYSILSYCAFLLSLIFLIFPLIDISTTIPLLFNASKAVEDLDEGYKGEIKDLLVSIKSENKNLQDDLLKNFSFLINGKNIAETDYTLEFKLFEPQPIIIDVISNETRAAKNVEVGFDFPKDFLIPRTTLHTQYSGLGRHVIRYNLNILHGDTRLTNDTDPLKITALKDGDFEMVAFLKGENIGVIKQKIKIIVNE